jgi:hypothetical protein
MTAQHATFTKVARRLIPARMDRFRGPGPRRRVRFDLLGTLHPAATHLGSAGANAGSGTESTLATEPDGAITQLGITPADAGTTDAAVSSDGQYLYVQAGGPGDVDAYRIGPGGALAQTGSVTVPGAVGGEGIAAS